MLKVENIAAYYGNVRVLDGVSLECPKGKIVSLIGPNGAGKTTTLRTILGLVKAKEGKVTFSGNDITGTRTDLIIKMGMALVPQGRAVFPTLTVMENLEMGAFVRRDRKEIAEDLQDVFSRFPILKERSRQRAGLLSGGEQQMLAIGRALMARPSLLLLDEPSLGLAPKVVSDIVRKVIEINARGTTILLVEQNARIALEMADFAYVLEFGKIRLSGTGEALRKDENIRKIYLGEK
jgi:branched-chain amino acid transport system ATP-binding protein